MQDTGRLILCTEAGEIMLLETSGEYMAFVGESPSLINSGLDFKIECIVPFSRGFLIALDNGLVYAYERTEDPRNPYRKINQIETKIDPNQTIQQQSFGIMSMTLTSSEDNLFFITENN
jgi:WD40 repeat protein